MSSRPTVRLIAAVARNGVMGKGGKLPWSIPEDWSHFLAAVKGGTCISGRRCYEELGQAMPGSGGEPKGSEMRGVRLGD